MPYLPYISDDDLLIHVAAVLQKGIAAKITADKKFHKNVVDPFGAIFETAINNVTTLQWQSMEKNRQIQKTLQNAIGDFHNDILGSVEGWSKLPKGNEIDLIKDDLTIIAEIKNKYNTVTGSKLVDHYNEFDNLVNNKASKYVGAKAYLVQIIPQNPKPFNDFFTPSDKAKGMKKPKDENIRKIDGRSFFQMVTGFETALDDLHACLPNIITHINLTDKAFNGDDLQILSSYFNKAYMG